jgi:spore coat protein B
MNHNYSKFIGENVKVNLGGPESRLGTLSIVASDFLAIQGDDGIMFYQLSHVKGISVQSTSSPTQTVERSDYEDMRFTEVLNAFKYKQVRINRGGPESVVGLLRKTSADYIELLVDKQIVILAVYHIKSFSPVFENEEESSNSGNSGNSGKNEKKNKVNSNNSNNSNNNRRQQNESSSSQNESNNESSNAAKESSSGQRESSSKSSSSKSSSSRSSSSSNNKKKRSNGGTRSRSNNSLSDRGWTKL